MKKVVALSLTIVMIAVMLVGCGGKNKVTIKMDINGEVTQQVYSTDAVTLEELIVEEQTKLKASLQDSDYGKFVTGMNGYVADQSKNEYFEFLIDDVAATVGIKETKIEDGKVYLFKLTTFKKEVTIKMDINGEETQQVYSTDAVTLEELLVEKQTKLKATFEDSDYGKFVTGMNGYTADLSKNEYFEFLVDGVAATVGIKDTNIEDGKVYLFKLSTFD